MENLMSRYRNVSILVAILFVQVLGLAVQVKRRTGADESTRIIRLWTVSAVTPLEKALVWCQNGLGGLWNNYIYLRGVRQENRDLKFEIERLRLDQVRLSEDAAQARRLQALLGFKEQYIAKTVAAQVIGSSGSEQSRSIYIDKGTSAGVEKDMAVITADGLVGRVLRAYGSSAQVLLMNDQSSGVGVILDKSRLQGVIKGTAAGEVILEKVMTDEQVSPGDLILTSGGDQIFPKGITVGTVMKVSPGADLFLNIRVKPSASLSRLEEVLVITICLRSRTSLRRMQTLRCRLSRRQHRSQFLRPRRRHRHRRSQRQLLRLPNLPPRKLRRRRINRTSVPITYTSQDQVEVYRFSAPVAIAIPLAALFLQAFLPLRIHFFSLFDLPLLVVIFFAVARRSPVAGLLTGSLIGLLQDSLTHQPIGIYGIAKTVVGFGASSLGAKLDVDNVGARFLVTLFFYAVHEVVYFTVARGLVKLTLQWNWGHEIGGALLNAATAAVLFTLLDRFKQRA